jgi:hypothetical protein
LLNGKAIQKRKQMKRKPSPLYRTILITMPTHLPPTDYCNGVGGISGASGRGTSLPSGPSSISAMTPKQQHQTLIYLLEKLVTLNHELQRTEAAMGVLDFAHKYLKTLDAQTEVKERWYEKLHEWQKVKARRYSKRKQHK